MVLRIQHIPVTAECAAASSWACVTSCWLGDTGTYWIWRGEANEIWRGEALPMLHLVLQGPYLGLLKEWGSLFILDVCDLALLYLERGSQSSNPRRRLCIIPLPTLAPGLDYLDVMALWDHNVFLGEQVLDSVLRDDVLHLKKGREQAGAGALLIGTQ